MCMHTNCRGPPKGKAVYPLRRWPSNSSSALSPKYTLTYYTTHASSISLSPPLFLSLSFSPPPLSLSLSYLSSITNTQTTHTHTHTLTKVLVHLLQVHWIITLLSSLQRLKHDTNMTMYINGCFCIPTYIKLWFVTTYSTTPKSKVWGEETIKTL
jgi:hypothetical protein